MLFMRQLEDEKTKQFLQIDNRKWLGWMVKDPHEHLKWKATACFLAWVTHFKWAKSQSLENPFDNSNQQRVNDKGA